MLYRGICRCGKVVFEIDGELTEAAAGSGPAPPDTDTPLCSIPRGSLRLAAEEESIGAYTFTRQVIGHRFCGGCGMHLYGEELGATQAPMAYVNMDCVEMIGVAQ